MMNELEKIDWDVIGLAEVRRKGEEGLELDNGEIFYYNGDGGQGGTGFIINKTLKKEVKLFKSYSTRVSKLILKSLRKNSGRIKLVQVYAPTTQSSEEEIEEFYINLQAAIEEDKCQYTVILGDLNAKVGERGNEVCVGEYGLGSRNERGERLVEFTSGFDMYIMNTFIPKNVDNRWTWMSPDGLTRNQIDYIITDKKELIEDVNVTDSLNTGSDHRPLHAVLRIKKMNKIHREKRIRYSTDQLKEYGYTTNLENNLMQIKNRPKDNINKHNEEIIKTIKNAYEKTTKLIPGTKSKNKLPIEIMRMLEKRRRFKRNNSNTAEVTELSKNIRKRINEWSHEREIKEIENAIKTGSSLKKINKLHQEGKKSIISMKNVTGKITHEVEEILEIIFNFYKELYSDKEKINNSEVNNTKDNEKVNTSTNKEPIILYEEVKRIIKNLKDGKAGGDDGIINEQLKAGGDQLCKELCSLFNQCLKVGKIPDKWLESNLILLFKKGDKNEIKNYRPINLLSVIYKVFMAVLIKRIEILLEERIPIDQIGFKKNYSTTDGILTVKKLIAKANEYNFPLCLLFIDFEKAFDSVKTSAILKEMKIILGDTKCFEIFKYIYKNSKIKIKYKGKFKVLELERGLRQGDVASAKIFTAVLEQIFHQLEWSGKGIKINGEFLNVIKFADDIILIGKSIAELKNMLRELVTEAKKVGLNVNCGKTKLMTMNVEGIIEIEGKPIEQVSEFIYLGSLVSTDNKDDKELSRRISLGWRAYNRYRKLFRSNCNMIEKNKLWKSVVLPSLTYACETWALTDIKLHRLRVAVRGMMRSMLKVTRKDRKTIEWLEKNTGLEDIGRVVARRKWQWAGHIARTRDDRWTKKILQWCPRDWKRDRGKPLKRWEDDFGKVCEYRTTWMRIAQDRREWIRLTNVFLNVYLSNS